MCGGLTFSELRQLESDNVAARNPAEPGADRALAVENQGRRCLHDVEMLSDVGAFGDVDIEVVHADGVACHLRERPVHPRASTARLRAELQERGGLAQGSCPKARRVDNGQRRVWVSRSSAQIDDRSCAQSCRQQRRNDDECHEQIHNS